MKHYYTIEIADIRFGDTRRITVRATSKQKAMAQAFVGIGEHIVAAWEL